MKFVFALLACIALVTAQPGGWITQSVKGLESDEAFGKMMTQAISQLESNGQLKGKGWSVDQIKTVSSQVVAGMNYKIDAVLKDSEGASQEWNIQIFYQPWTKTLDVTSAQQVSDSNNI
mmetsp:Transcript_26726/g.23678  ORF Transcript_26726/g.23678 Transcript_26726/m.23678 type:complete len:119 (-) Transcript_26726:374-730(-)